MRDPNERIARLLSAHWQLGRATGMVEWHIFQEAVELAVVDAVGERTIDFAEPIDDQGTVLLLADDRLYTIRSSEDSAFTVMFLGELPGGLYEERTKIEHEIGERTMHYEHPRLPGGGKIKFVIPDDPREATRFEPLRNVLREWSMRADARVVLPPVLPDSKKTPD